MTFFDDPDRGARSNPLTNPKSSVVSAPEWQLHKHKIASDTAAVAGRLAASVTKSMGCNCREFDNVTVQAVPRNGTALSDAPGGTGTLTVTMYEWSDGEQRFVASPVASAAGPGGAGETVTAVVPCKGKVLYFHVAGVQAAGSASVYVQGYGLEDRS